MARPAAQAGINERTDAGSSWVLTPFHYFAKSRSVFLNARHFTVSLATSPMRLTTIRASNILCQLLNTHKQFKVFWPASGRDAWAVLQACDTPFFLRSHSEHNRTCLALCSWYATSVCLSRCVQCPTRAVHQLREIRISSFQSTHLPRTESTASLAYEHGVCL